jgi:hypothetical protein
MDPWAKLDLYCERADASFWAEPLNALTNLAFVVAAVLIAEAARRSRRGLGWEAAVLAGLTLLVGAGSFLFHTFATVWGRWLDLVFIAAFIYVFLGLCLARVAAFGWRGVVVGIVVYAVLERAVLGAVPPGAIGGSLLYLPPLLALTALAWYAGRRRHPAAPRLATAVGVFAAALVVRTADLTLCEIWPAGTHFVWHVLTAGVLYLAATAVLAPGGALTRN